VFECLHHADGVDLWVLGVVERPVGGQAPDRVEDWERVARLGISWSVEPDPAEVLHNLISWYRDFGARGEIIHLLCISHDYESDLLAVTKAGDFAFNHESLGSYSAPLGSPSEIDLEVIVIDRKDLEVSFGQRSVLVATLTEQDQLVTDSR
jgi:hypothetical protein